MLNNQQKYKKLKILIALAFYPRGGSAQVVRYLSRALINLGHEVKIVAGSLKNSSREDASEFFSGLSLTEVDYSKSYRSYFQGENPFSEKFDFPLSPSYEDKVGVPDKVFYKVSKKDYKNLVEAWRKVFKKASEGFRPDIVHLHHLNHIHEAALLTPEFENSTKIAHLHGTELKMLSKVSEVSKMQSTALLNWWKSKLEKLAGKMNILITNNKNNINTAKELLNLKNKELTFMPNGVDTHIFKKTKLSRVEKLKILENYLVKSPRGWDETGVEGSIRYKNDDLKIFLDKKGDFKPIVLFVGRFLGFKRLNLLLQVVAMMGESFTVLIVGGFPGEWEGTHPYTLAKNLGLKNIFFLGWHEHDTVAGFFNLADVFVGPSFHEPFGQVFLESLACEVPVITTKSGGPQSFIIENGEKANGWFCKLDDVNDLRQKLVKVLGNPQERKRRGKNGATLVNSFYTWSNVAQKFVDLYQEVPNEKLS